MNVKAEFPKGSKVLIKKGTPIRTTGTHRHKIAGKDYVVTLHHTLTGVRITASTALHDRAYKYRLAEMGINQADLEKLRVTNPEAYFRDCNIQITKPSVVWAGTGGYWHECDADLVELVELPVMKEAA